MSEDSSPAEKREARSPASDRADRRRKSASVKYTAAEWDAVLERARVAGKTPGRYIRDASLRQLPRRRLAEIRELGKSAMALMGLAATARTTGALPERAALEEALAELLTAVRRMPLTGP